MYIPVYSKALIMAYYKFDFIFRLWEYGGPGGLVLELRFEKISGSNPHWPGVVSLRKTHFLKELVNT